MYLGLQLLGSQLLELLWRGWAGGQRERRERPENVGDLLVKRG